MNHLLQYLEPAAHVALIAVAVAVSWTYWSAEEPATSAPTVHVDSSRVLRAWRPDKQRVVLFVSPTCPYCVRSMDFYARLGRAVDSLQQTGAPVALAAVIDDSDVPHVQRQVLRDAHVSVDTLLQISASSLMPVGISKVPTVAILSSSGQTRSSWVGLQDSTEEREILAAVRTLAPSP